MMDIVLRISSKMRYATAGDYYVEKGKIIIEVFDQRDQDKNFLVLLHELVEHYLTARRHISIAEVDEFDFRYEQNRKIGDTTSEPGDDPSCPYRREHRFAMIVEQMMALELGVDWNEYDKNIKVYEPATEG